MNKTLLVDAQYLLKKSFFGAKNSYTDKFGHIGGLYSFMTTLRKLITDYNINKIVLAWDGENGGIYRHNIDLAYKANRTTKKWHQKINMTDAQIKFEEQKEESLLKQKKRIQQYCEELFIRQIEVDDIEADDIIAEYCKRYHKNEDIIIFTNDRDFCQLLQYDIQIKFGNIDKLINKDNFFMYFTYYYGNALTMKIICGDTSDNVEGIKGVQEKTLLKHFPDLKKRKVTVNEIFKGSLIKNKQRIKEKKEKLKVFSNISEGLERLKLNHKLMDLENPILNDDALEELKQLEAPLSPEGRTSKNLYKLMKEDQFLEQYNSTFVDYIERFYSVISHEKQFYKKYYSN